MRKKLGGSFENYETPPHYVQALKDLIGSPRQAYEPCVGSKNIVAGFPETKWLTNDLDPRVEAATHQDATTKSAWVAKADWCITNPPFSQELEIARHALIYHPNVAFLARLSFLEPTKSRSDFWFGNPPTSVIVLPRYRFKGTGTDSMTCCWVIWQLEKSPCLRFEPHPHA